MAGEAGSTGSELITPKQFGETILSKRAKEGRVTSQENDEQRTKATRLVREGTQLRASRYEETEMATDREGSLDSETSAAFRLPWDSRWRNAIGHSIAHHGVPVSV